VTSPFLPELVNGPFGDPGLYIGLPRSGTALLLDLGNLDRFPAAKLYKLTHIFVSHTHIDHFVGFDRVLRLFLGRDALLRIYGPPGIIENVKGKLRGYTWNLIDGYPLVFELYEVDVREIRGVRLSAATAFAPEPLGHQEFSGVLSKSSEVVVSAVHLDHRIPSMAFAVQEPRRIKVRKDDLERSKLQPGAWIEDLKQAIREKKPPDTMIAVESSDGASQTISLGTLRNELVEEAPGEKLAYVVDAGFTTANAGRIVELARDADVFFCESPFVDEDREQACKRYHLTARQAGSLARWAGVKRLCPFHFSPRYSGQAPRLVAEAEAVYRGELAPDDPD